MYYLGDGENNLKKMDQHLKRTNGGIKCIFNQTIMNDETLRKIKRRKIKFAKTHGSRSHSTIRK